MRKKILLVSSEFPPLPGGIGNHAFHLAQNLVDHGYQLTVVTDQRTLDISEKDFDKNLSFKVVRIPLYKKLRVLTYLQRLVKISSLMHEQDIVIASGKFSLWSVGIISKWKKKKTLAVIHGSEVNFSNRFLKSFTNYALKSFDRVIAVSNFTKSLIKELALEKLSVIPNGYLIKENPKLKEFKGGTLRLITVGSVTHRKGQENVIRALPELAKVTDSIYYHMVGTPKEKDRFFEIAQSLGVADKIKFHGIVSDQRKNELLQESHIFVMLSNQTSSGDVEGFGIALIEGCHFGLPSVGAMDCGIEDAILEGTSGRLIRANDVQSFVTAVKEITSRYSEYSAGARKWSENFTWKKIIQKYIELIEE